MEWKLRCLYRTVGSRLLAGDTFQVILAVATVVIAAGAPAGAAQEVEFENLEVLLHSDEDVFDSCYIPEVTLSDVSSPKLIALVPEPEFVLELYADYHRQLYREPFVGANRDRASRGHGLWVILRDFLC